MDKRVAKLKRQSLIETSKKEEVVISTFYGRCTKLLSDLTTIRTFYKDDDTSFVDMDLVIIELTELLLEDIENNAESIRAYKKSNDGSTAGMDFIIEEL